MSLKQTRISNIRKNYISALFLLLLFSLPGYSQHKVYHNTDNLATISFGNKRENGFRISLSLVALFTAGAADRNGFRLGADLTVSHTVNNWTALAGLDAYKAKEKFGLGTSFAGLIFDDGKYGGSYYVNKYFQGGRQISGIVGLRLNDFRLNFEDDILAYPFTGFKIYDRYRSAALELRYKGFIIGTNVYTTEINGVTDASFDNSKGVYLTGKQISSPIYMGYTRNDLILRYGINSKAGGFMGQNGWHQALFNTPDFNYGEYKNHFLQIGVDKPYTLY